MLSNRLQRNIASGDPMKQLILFCAYVGMTPREAQAVQDGAGMPALALRWAEAEIRRRTAVAARREAEAARIEAAVEVVRAKA